MNDQLLTGIFDFDFDGPDDSQDWEGRYRIIQYNNTEKKIEFPLAHWTGSEIEGNHELIQVEHGEAGEIVEPGFLLDTINIAVITHRSIWEAKKDGEMIYTQKPDFSFAKWNKRINFLCILQEAGDLEPVILTVKSYTADFTFKAIANARKRNIALIKRTTGQEKPGYLAWITLTPGPKQIVGKEVKNKIYPPVALVHDIAKLKKPAIMDLLKALYVGDEIRDEIVENLYAKGQKWALETPAELPQLAAPQPTVEVKDGQLIFPDMSEAKPGAMIDLAAAIPGMFEARDHASRAFAKALRNANIRNNDSGLQWSAWKAEIHDRWMANMPLAIAERSAMDEVEAEENEIPF